MQIEAEMTGSAENLLISESPGFKHLWLCDATVREQAPDHRM
jgi:hypothetical protein